MLDTSTNKRSAEIFCVINRFNQLRCLIFRQIYLNGRLTRQFLKKMQNNAHFYEKATFYYAGLDIYKYMQLLQ